MTYDKMDIVDFGRGLFESNDLDPVYVTLYELVSRGVWDRDQLKRWLVAYWCFYSCGFASYVSEFEGPQYWEQLGIAAENKIESPAGCRWPRGAERRHFRGRNATDGIAMLHTRYDRPEQMVDYIVGSQMMDPQPFKTVCARVREHSAFGPWIGFKVCDMLDRVMEVPVDFDQAAIFMFKDPVKAVIMLWRQATGYGKEAKPKDLSSVIDQVVTMLSGEFKEFKAPPLYDRPVGLQEVETVLCKWKSHMNGHYPMGKDTREITEGLAPWAGFTSAQEFGNFMPK